LSVKIAVVEGNGGDGCRGTEVAGDGVRERCGSGMPHGFGVVIESFGDGVGSGELAGGSLTGRLIREVRNSVRVGIIGIRNGNIDCSPKKGAVKTAII
jgi:hypothetical protein